MLSIRSSTCNKAQKTRKSLERITKIKAFISEFNRTALIFYQEKMTGKNSKITIQHPLIALKVLYIDNRNFGIDIQKIHPAFSLKHNSELEKQIILLMIPNEVRWHYIAVTKLFALLREVTSKNW